MRSVTIGLAAVITCVGLAAVPSGAQSRTTNTLRKSVRQPETAGSLYPFMDTAAFPQEWHGRQRSAEDEDEVAAPPPRQSSTSTTSYGIGRTARLHAGEAAESTYVPRTRRTAPVSRRLAARTMAAAASNLEPQMRPGSSGSAARSARAPRRTANRLLPTSRPAAHQQLNTANSRSSGNPYAFIDTVGFPETYRGTAARDGDETPRRSIGATTRKARSRSTVPQGYVEVR